MPIPKPLVFGGIVAASLIVVGAARIATRTTATQTNTTDPNAMLGEINSAVGTARAVGHEQGVREAVAPPNLDAALVARGAVLESALELAQADVDALVCARAGQYLTSAREAQATGAVDVERWLVGQLTQENAAVKTLMANHGSMDGSGGNAAALDSPLRNRAAILFALRSLYAGESPSCRVAAFDSSTQIDSFSFEASRIKENQQRAMQPQPSDTTADGEGGNDGDS